MSADLKNGALKSVLLKLKSTSLFILFKFKFRNISFWLVVIDFNNIIDQFFNPFRETNHSEEINNTKIGM